MTSTNIRIVEISVAERFDDAMAVLAESWADMGFDFELRPDVRNLAAVERVGMFVMIGAFDEDRMVGCVSAYLSPHPFNPSVIVCAASAPAVRHAYRDGTTRTHLIRETERIAKQRGASRIGWSVRADAELLESLGALGYNHLETSVEKTP